MTERKMSCYLIILVICSMFSYVSGVCICALVDPGIDYCTFNPGFSAVFKIKDNGTVDGSQLAYDVDILYKYAFKAPSGNVETDRLYTYADVANCGVRLRPDSFYIITGYFEVRPDNPAKMKTSECQIYDYYKENPIENGDPPSCERSDEYVEISN